MSDRINVIRAPRDSEHAYFAVSRALTQDRRLSFEARGVLAYLLSKPSDWIVRVQDLQKEGNCGRDRIYRILKELRDAGYLHRDQEHQPNGTFTWGPYRVYEQPFTDKADMVAQQQEAEQPFTEKPYTDKPDTVKPYTDNTHIYKEESSTDQRVIQKREGQAQAPARKPVSEKQTNLDSFNQAVLVYKELSGKRQLAPAITSLIVNRVSDMGLWRTVIENWVGCGYNVGGVKDMLDWYDHPEKMAQRLARNSGKGSPPPMKSSGPLVASKPNIAPDAMTPAEFAKAAKEYRNGTTPRTPTE